MEASIPTPKRELDKPFLMPVEDIFSIAGRGTVCTGRIELGKLKVGDEVEIVGLIPTQKTTCTGKSHTRPLIPLYCSPVMLPCTSLHYLTR